VPEYLRLDHLAHDQLGHDEEREGDEECAPARIDHRREKNRQSRRDVGADKGHEAHQHGEHAPDDGARDAD
jgi:hypothetical protein